MPLQQAAGRHPWSLAEGGAMTHSDDAMREIAALRERIAALNSCPLGNWRGRGR